MYFLANINKKFEESTVTILDSNFWLWNLNFKHKFRFQITICNILNYIPKLLIHITGSRGQRLI